MTSNGSVNGSPEVSYDVGRRAEAAAISLDELQKVAAERRALAEEMLVKAREFEQQLATESGAIADATSLVEAARNEEGDAAHRLLEAQRAVAAAARELSTRQEERARAEAAVCQMRERMEKLVAANGFSAEAMRHIVERRISDKLRNGDAVP